jgi:hypothetical protein
LIGPRAEAEWQVRRTGTPGNQYPSENYAYDAWRFHGVTSAEQELALRLLEGAVVVAAVVRRAPAGQQGPLARAALEGAAEVPQRQRLRDPR